MLMKLTFVDDPMKLVFFATKEFLSFLLLIKDILLLINFVYMWQTCKLNINNNEEKSYVESAT